MTDDISKVMQYRKKPVVIEAMQLAADLSHEFNDALHAFMAGCDWCSDRDGIQIETLEGTMHASPGDWIIKGVKGEFYPCKPDIFAATYEPAAHPSRGVVDELPALPSHQTQVWIIGREDNRPEMAAKRYYTVDQMREYARAALQAAQPAASVEGLRQGNWQHPEGGRIVGWVIEPDDVERMKAEAFCLPREVSEALENLRKAALPAASGCYTCGHPKHDGYCVDPKWATAAKCDELLSRALRAESALAKAAQPAVPSEFMGWVHEVAWIDGTSRTLHQKEPTPLDDSPGLTSQRVVRVFAQPAVPSVPEGLRVVGRVQRGPAPHDPLYALILPGVDDSTIPEGTPLYALAATPKDQP